MASRKNFSWPFILALALHSALLAVLMLTTVFKPKPIEPKPVPQIIHATVLDAAKMRAKAEAKRLAEEAKKSGYWDAAYTNKIKDEVPSDLKKGLTEDSKAWNNFEKFANSYRNMYIGWVTGSKTEATRKKRIAEVVKRSALNKKPGIE